MKRLIIISLLASAAWAADFSQMSTEEMMNMRGSVPIDDRPAFREEMQKRMQSMHPEERQKYMNSRGMGQGLGKGKIGGQKCCLNNMPTFEQYDLNNDGKITQNELEEARTKRMSQKAKEGKMLINAGNAPAFTNMDKNKDGSLNKEEFRLHQTEQKMKCNKRNSATGNCPTPSKGNCPNNGKGMMKNARNTPAFADIDTNNDGMISQEEFSAHQTQRIQNRGNCPGGNCP